MWKMDLCVACVFTGAFEAPYCHYKHVRKTGTPEYLMITRDNEDSKSVVSNEEGGKYEVFYK